MLFHLLLVPQIIKFGWVHGCPIKSTFPTAKGGQWDVCKNDHLPACPPKSRRGGRPRKLGEVESWVRGGTWTRE